MYLSCVHACTQGESITVHAWRAEDSLWESVPSFHSRILQTEFLSSALAARAFMQSVNSPALKSLFKLAHIHAHSDVPNRYIVIQCIVQFHHTHLPVPSALSLRPSPFFSQITFLLLSCHLFEVSK